MAHRRDEYRQPGSNGHVFTPIDAFELIGAMSWVLTQVVEVSLSEAMMIYMSLGVA